MSLLTGTIGWDISADLPRGRGGCCCRMGSLGGDAREEETSAGVAGRGGVNGGRKCRWDCCGSDRLGSTWSYEGDGGGAGGQGAWPRVNCSMRFSTDFRFGSSLNDAREAEVRESSKGESNSNTDMRGAGGGSWGTASERRYQCSPRRQWVCAHGCRCGVEEGEECALPVCGGGSEGLRGGVVGGHRGCRVTWVTLPVTGPGFLSIASLTTGESWHLNITSCTWPENQAKTLIDRFLVGENRLRCQRRLLRQSITPPSKIRQSTALHLRARQLFLSGTSGVGNESV